MAHVSLLDLRAYGKLYTPTVYHVTLWNFVEGELYNDAIDDLSRGEVAIGFESMTFPNGSSTKMVKLLSPRGILGWVYFEGLKEVT